MSRRIKSAEESARRDRQKAESIKTLVADRTAPRNPNHHGQHYRSHLIDTLVVVDQLQARIVDLEATLARVRADAAYNMSLCVTRGEAERARLGAGIAMRERAACLFEWHGAPTAQSEAIRELPDPRPKFTH